MVKCWRRVWSLYPCRYSKPSQIQNPWSPHVGNSLSRGDGQSDLKSLSNIIHSVIVFPVSHTWFWQFYWPFHSNYTILQGNTINISLFSPLPCSAFNESCRAQSLLISWGTQKPRDWLKDNQESEGPNVQSVTSPSQSSTATAMPVQVVFPGKCLVYQAHSDSRGWRHWRQHCVHRCSPWTANPSKGKMLLCFAREQWCRQLCSTELSWTTSRQAGAGMELHSRLLKTGFTHHCFKLHVRILCITWFVFSFSQYPSIRFGQGTVHKNQHLFS